MVQFVKIVAVEIFGFWGGTVSGVNPVLEISKKR